MTKQNKIDELNKIASTIEEIHVFDNLEAERLLNDAADNIRKAAGKLIEENA